MGDGYWNRQQAQYPASGLLKRPRTDYELQSPSLPSSHEMHNYLTEDNSRGGTWAVSDTKSIGSAYDRYLQNSQAASLTSGEMSAYSGAGWGRDVAGGISGRAIANTTGVVRGGGGGLDRLTVSDPPGIARSMPAGADRVPVVESPGMTRSGAIGLDLATNGRSIGYGSQIPVEAMPRQGRETVPLPPDASSTLYVEGLPPDSRRREVAHIFRPFVGYKEVRLVTKEPKHRSGDPIVLCFVDFATPACAATAMSALQGYKMDEHDPDSGYLRLQFSRFPGPRSGSGSRGKR